jgi:carbamoyl-phosphate synthase large subunit
MRSTGEVMGWDRTYPRAFLKAQLGAGQIVPEGGKVFISVKDMDKNAQMIEAAEIMAGLGFGIVATSGTAGFLRENGITVETVNKVYEGRPNIVDMMKNGEITMVFNTTEGAQSVEDSRDIRRVALYDKIVYFTTAAGSHSMALAMQNAREGEIGVRSLQG